MKKLLTVLLLLQSVHGMGRGSEDYGVREAAGFLQGARALNFIVYQGLDQRDCVGIPAGKDECGEVKHISLEQVVRAIGASTQQYSITEVTFPKSSASLLSSEQVKALCKLPLTKLQFFWNPIETTREEPWTNGCTGERFFKYFFTTAQLPRLRSTLTSLTMDNIYKPHKDAAVQVRGALRDTVRKSLCHLTALKYLSLQDWGLEGRDWDAEYNRYERDINYFRPADPQDSDNSCINQMLVGLISRGMKLDSLDLAGNNILMSQVPESLQAVVVGATCRGKSTCKPKPYHSWHLP